MPFFAFIAFLNGHKWLENEQMPSKYLPGRKDGHFQVLDSTEVDNSILSKIEDLRHSIAKFSNA